MAGDGAAADPIPAPRRRAGDGEAADRLLRDLDPDRAPDLDLDLDLGPDLGLGLDLDLGLDPMEAAPGPDPDRMEADLDPAAVVVVEGRTEAADIANLWRL